jgi:hypothetical protein
VILVLLAVCHSHTKKDHSRNMKKMIIISGFLAFICFLIEVGVDCITMQYVVLPAMKSLGTGGITSVKTHLGGGLSTPFSPLMSH